MGVSAYLALPFNLTLAGTELAHIVGGAVHRPFWNVKNFSALLACSLHARLSAFGIASPQSLHLNATGTLKRAVLLICGWRGMENLTAHGAGSGIVAFVGRRNANPSAPLALPVAVMVLIGERFSDGDLFGLAAVVAMNDDAFSHRFVSAFSTAILLLGIAGRYLESSVADRALAGSHKRNLLSDGGHVCLGHAAPTGGIHNYIRLGANHQTRTCPKHLHYTTSAAGVHA